MLFLGLVGSVAGASLALKPDTVWQLHVEVWHDFPQLPAGFIFYGKLRDRLSYMRRYVLRDIYPECRKAERIQRDLLYSVFIPPEGDRLIVYSRSSDHAFIKKLAESFSKCFKREIMKSLEASEWRVKKAKRIELNTESPVECPITNPTLLSFDKKLTQRTKQEWISSYKAARKQFKRNLPQIQMTSSTSQDSFVKFWLSGLLLGAGLGVALGTSLRL